ncbi:cation diffusion facilitator family transporter [Fervidobacterium changbaicum]|uniref:Cation diffusion facilitator family transporter n=2 Tax=Fervidobacterium TaxID=2422 RepID=A0AAI8CKW8_FERIS|nr:MULTISPECIES: cation diffusion facilitator family transporter [Fervidobacterium]AMW32118.1 cation diffusion facilitator family transporter [Fervidobacterium islandicum]QAV33890.1 cation transporter [Fervidobacterium changbaicum]SDH73448.1 cation diffusion facilitator family transporter [Fervidobacterium changbaicum]
MSELNADKAIKKVALIAVFTNILLAVLKVSIGLIFKSMAVLADGIDTSTDILTSSTMLVATLISRRPPDKGHPYGHHKAENIGAKIISFVIFYAGVSLLIESAKRLITGEYEVLMGILPLLAAILSVGGKTFLFLIEYTTGKKYKSNSMVAEAKNMRNDIIMSSLVFVGVALNKIGLAWMDPLVGIVMSGIIIKVAWEVFEENAHDLMDGLRKEEMWIYEKVFEACQKCGAHNPHKVRVRKVGGKFDIDMDIEVDGKMNVKDAHEITKCIKKHLCETKEIYDVVIHVEPEENDEHEPFGLTKESFEKDERKNE